MLYPAGMAIYVAHGEYVGEDGAAHQYSGLGVESYSIERAQRRIELVLGGTVRGIRETDAWPITDAFELDPKLEDAAKILRGYDAWSRPGMGTFHLDIS